MSAGVEVFGDGVVGPAVHAHAERDARPAVGVQDRDQDDPVEGRGRGRDPGPGLPAEVGPRFEHGDQVHDPDDALELAAVDGGHPEIDLPGVVRPEPGADVAVAERAGEGRRPLSTL